MLSLSVNRIIEHVEHFTPGIGYITMMSHYRNLVALNRESIRLGSLEDFFYSPNIIMSQNNGVGIHCSGMSKAMSLTISPLLIVKCDFICSSALSLTSYIVKTL